MGLWLLQAKEECKLENIIDVTRRKELSNKRTVHGGERKSKGRNLGNVME